MKSFQMLTFAVFLSLFSLLLFGCGKEEDKSVDDNSPKIVPMELFSLGTKTALDQEGTVKWLPGDMISVFDKAGNHKFITEEGGVSAVFNGSALSDFSSTLMLYPYDSIATVDFERMSVKTFIPAEQFAQEGSFSERGNITVARVDDYSFMALNACGLLKLRISRSDVMAVDIVSNDRKVLLAGTVRISFDGEGAPAVAVEKGSHIVSLSGAGDVIQAGEYYLDVIPSKMTSGYTLRLKLADGRISEIERPEDISVSASSYVDIGVVDEKVSVTADCLNLSFYDVAGGVVLQPFTTELPVAASVESASYCWINTDSKHSFDISSIGGYYLSADQSFRGLRLTASGGSASIKLPSVSGMSLYAVGIASGSTKIGTVQYRVTRSIDPEGIASPCAIINAIGSMTPTVSSEVLDEDRPDIAYYLYTEDSNASIAKLVLTYRKSDVSMVASPKWIKAMRQSHGENDWTMTNETNTVDCIAGFCPVGEPETDEYGGWKCSLKFSPTGHFYCSRADGRWWMVDPLGNPFISKGVCGFTIYSDSGITAAAYEEKYSSDPMLWANGEWEMLKYYGFNSLGAFGREEYIKKYLRTPYVLTRTPMDDYLASIKEACINRYGQDNWRGEGPFNFPMVFDEGFAAMCDKVFSKVRTDGFAADPYVIGIMTDNEFPVNTAFLKTCLDWPDTTHVNCQQAKRWLTDNGYDREQALSSIDICRKFAAFCYETYLEKVSASIKKYAPEVMFLGTKQTGTNYMTALLNDYTYSVAAKYVDAFSIDFYGAWAPEPSTLRHWSELCGKPLILAEWYVKGADIVEYEGGKYLNTSGVGWTVPTQVDRGLFYQNYILNCIKSGAVVGWHWFKYCDGDPDCDGWRNSSSEDSNKGLVSRHLIPFTGCLEQMKQVNDQVYPLNKYLK